MSSICDELNSESWHKVVIDEKSYIAKFRSASNGYAAMMCDGVNTWQEKVNGVEITNRNRELNPNVEASSEALLGHVRATLLSKESNVSSKITEDHSLHLRCKVRISGLPFLWQFLMSRACDTTHAHHLTIPLIGMNAELSRRIDELYRLLKLKDAVISHLKGDGTQVPNLPRSLKGGDVPFDPESFWKDMDSNRQVCQVSNLAVPNFDAKCFLMYAWIMAEIQSSLCSDQHSEALIEASPTSQAVLTHSPQTDNSALEADLELLRKMELEKRRAEELRLKAETRKKKKLNL